MSTLPRFGLVEGFLVATNNGNMLALRADAIIAVEAFATPGEGCKLHLAQSDRVYPIDQSLERVLAVLPIKEGAR
jgi:hypothetical protein